MPHFYEADSRPLPFLPRDLGSGLFVILASVASAGRTGALAVVIRVVSNRHSNLAIQELMSRHFLTIPSSSLNR
jgi:hypothetical protein